jgi:beta-phosphoglucomutase family hydrolase
MNANSPLDPKRFQAVLFDLDGVLTATAKVHAAAWKQLFDAFLESWSREHHQPFEPFDLESDYKAYVDGKSRYDGVASFLEARGIQLPYGDPQGPPNSATVCGLGQRKDELVQAVLACDGVEVYPGSIALVRVLRQQGIKTGVVSASRNCLAVLQAARIEALFDARVDGVVADELALPGKPNPQMFLLAARQLGVPPGHAAVVEDAIAGVQAARAGGFGLVVGIARSGEGEALREAGADLVVADLGEWT